MAADFFRILVVDDDASIRELTNRILLAQGYNVDTAVDGSAALEQISSNSYDLVLLDIQMPGLDGFEVCRKIRQQRQLARLPLIFLSGSEMTDDMLTEVKESGASMFMMKPYNIAELNRAVANAIESKLLPNGQ